MYYFLLIIILIVSLYSNSSAQEQITTINNQTIYGFIIEENAQYIKLINENGNQVTLNTQTISARNKIQVDIYLKNFEKQSGHIIESEKHYLLIENNNTKFKLAQNDINYIVLNNHKMIVNDWDDLIPYTPYTSYFSIGATLGFPAAINFEFMYNFHTQIGVRLSGMHLNRSIEGIEFDFVYSLPSSGNFSAGFYCGIGYSKLPYSYNEENYSKNIRIWRYGNIGGELNYNDFFAKLGVSMGTGDYPNPHLLGNLGFIHRFKN